MIELLHAAARGTFAPEDGRTDVVGPVDGAPAAVLSFTSHHVVAAELPAGKVLGRIDPGDLKGPLAPGVLSWLAERTGLVAGSLDVVLAWVPERAVPGAALAARAARVRGRWRPTPRRCGRCSRPASRPSAPRCCSARLRTSCAVRRVAK